METITIAPTSASYTVAFVGDRLSVRHDGPASFFRTNRRDTVREVVLMWNVDFDGYEYLRSIIRKNEARGNPPWNISLILDNHAPTDYTMKFVQGSIAMQGRAGLGYTITARALAIPGAVLSGTDYPDPPAGGGGAPAPAPAPSLWLEDTFGVSEFTLLADHPPVVGGTWQFKEGINAFYISGNRLFDDTPFGVPSVYYNNATGITADDIEVEWRFDCVAGSDNHQMAIKFGEPDSIADSDRVVEIYYYSGTGIVEIKLRNATNSIDRNVLPTGNVLKVQRRSGNWILRFNDEVLALKNDGVSWTGKLGIYGLGKPNLLLTSYLAVRAYSGSIPEAPLPVISGTYGRYTLTGKPARLGRQSLFAAANAVFALNGQDATISVGSPPPADGDAIRVSGAYNCNETGDATAGWNYEALASGFINGGTLDSHLASGVDGDIKFTVNHVVTPGFNTVMGFALSPSFSFSVGDMAYGIWAHQAGVYYTADGGSYVNTGETCAMGDQVRATRTGDTITWEKNSGSGWTLLHQYTGVPTGDLWIWLNMANAGSTAYNLRGNGLVT